MTNRLKVLLIIGVATSIVALLIIDNLNRPSGELSWLGSENKTAPTGRLDNAVNEVLEDMTLEESLAAEVDDDSALLTSDSQEINAISQTYAESEF